MSLRTLILLLIFKLLFIPNLLALQVKQTTVEVQKEVIEPNRIEQQINNLRKEQGLHALVPDLCLRERAKIRSIEAQEKWSHTRPNGQMYWTSHNCGYGDIKIGENLANGTGDIVDAWLLSPSHKEVIFSNKYNRIGVFIGEYTVMEVQD